MAPTNTTPTVSFNRRLGAYSTLAAAGACAVAVSPQAADANVVYSGAMNVTMPGSITGVFVNMLTFSTGTTYAAVNGGNANTPALNMWGTSTSRVWLYPTASGTNALVANGTAPAELAANALISAASAFQSSATGGSPLVTAGGWAAGTTGYLGFRILNGAQTLYGWALLKISAGVPSAGDPMILMGMAYEDSGAAIRAGQTTSAPSVPDSGNTLALLATGCAATASLAWRRRKAA